MTNDHSTARPWKLNIEELGSKIFSQEGDLIADLYTTGSWEADEANAKLIVKAVNSYDDSIALAQAVMRLGLSESLHLMAYKILHSKG